MATESRQGGAAPAKRVDYEFLPSFTGPPTFSSTGQVVTHGSGLTPNGFSIGVTWRLLGY